MKIIQKVAALTILGSSFAYSVQFNVSGSNFSDLISDTVITDSAGNPIAVGQGFAGIGSFGSDPRGIEVSDLSEAFNALASNSFDASALIGAPVPGFYSISGQPDSGDANVIAAGDLPVYLFFANNSDPSLATEFGVVEVTGATFESAFAGPGPFSLNAGIEGGDAVVGALGAGVEFTDFSATSAASFALVAIPEPSSAILAGLALVGGLVRRRR